MYAILTGVSFLLLFGVVFWATTRFMDQQIDASVASEIAEILADPESSAPGGLQATIQGLISHSPGFYYLLQAPSGNVLAGNLPATEAVVGIREWGGQARQKQNAFSALRGRGVEVPQGYLFVGSSTLQVHEMGEMVRRLFLGGAAVALLLALAGGAIMSMGLLRRIETVSQTSRDIVNGDLQRRIPVRDSGDEFDHLAVSLNAMLDRIQTLMEDLRQVTTDIAHDLRTPLTRLRQRLELAQRPSVDPGTLRTVLDATGHDIDGILEIFSALLRIAQIESGARKAGFKQVNVSDLLHTVLEVYRPALEEKDQQLQETIEGDLTTRGDRELLMQLFANLVENATRHCPPGARVACVAQRRSDAVEVSVADNGPGIPEALRGKVLQRFFRLETSRTTSGSGLGLSLAAAVATLHDARLDLSDNAPGLRVTVSLRTC
ncbi:MAG TPA: HAMP domain-containing sensor histidine kinase [Burkholderiaceae bacterium]|nr:HAMP domain-containing sensor histidine kinase [Burkholderiaceae bacterium]